MLEPLGPGHDPLGFQQEADGRKIPRDGLTLDEPVDENGKNPGRESEEKEGV